MDVEKTIEFLLNEQAKTEALRLENEALRRENEARWKANDERWARTEKRINAIIKTGMKALLRHDERINILIATQDRTVQELGASIKEVAEAQKRTEAALERFLNKRPNGSNGR
jgi:hypothetical protein